MVKVAAFQIKIASFNDNFKKIEDKCKKLQDENVDILCLPEKWSQTDVKPEYINDDHPFLNKISNLAKKYKIYIILGALSEKENESSFVTSYFFGKHGELLGKQRKIHLYSFESKYYARGSEFKIFDTEFGKIAITICFDLNAFPEVARALALKGVDLIFNPVMVFESGIENWHIYLKSRALENRLPLVGVNGVGKSPMGTNLTGESLIIKFRKGHESPAKMKFELGKKSEEDLIISNIDLDYPRQIRQKRLAEIQDFKIV